MEISVKSIAQFGAVFLTGLSAGFFYAWSVSVIPGTLKVSSIVYLETMQSINRAILNPPFFIVFFGTMILLGTSSVLHFNTNQTVFWMFLAATLTYLIGTFGVTAFGNVPLNNQLESLNLTDLTPGYIAEFREYYETNWNRLHMIRTAFALAAFMITLLAIFVQSKH